MIRKWNWSNGNIIEDVVVEKNGVCLNEEELTNFQNYLLHLIPPGLLNLYFFDGEKIAEFFLGEQRSNLKNALLTLSGNDTYEILYNSIRRMLNGVESGNESIAQNYADQKEVLIEYLRKQNELSSKLMELESEIEILENSIKTEEETYATGGGISLKEWKELQDKIKDEEELREKLNSERKTAATEILPFLIVVDTLKKVYDQVNLEKELQKHQAIKYAVSTTEFTEFLSKAICQHANVKSMDNMETLVEKIQSFFSVSNMLDKKILFDLSGDEEAALINMISTVLKYDRTRFEGYQNDINQSIERSKIMRDTVKMSSIENFEAHIQTLSKLNYDLEKAVDKKEQLTLELQQNNENVEAVNKTLDSTRKALEVELKQQSVAALSDRMILLVEELQEQQYRSLISAVEADLNNKFKQLIRKDDFVSHIYIDLDFNLHLIRYQDIEIKSVKETIRKHGVKALRNSIKDYAYEELIKKLNSTEEKLAFDITDYDNDTIELPVELDYTRFSNGEKQILVMSLYWAIMNQSQNELPFIIDTPFARIDTEHRANITEMFFKELNGQLFVLSTNEELRHEHLAALDEQISKLYLLEYGSDKRTHITQGNYFEV